MTDILNSSFQEARLPQSWKDADITAIPRQKPIYDVNKHLCPINTTHALLSMIHSWLSVTDGNGATVRAILLDFCKAFDLIHHHLILVDKLRTYDIPPAIVSWIVDFLSCGR